MSGWADGQAVIAVQQRKQDGARQRMDLAHELGHLMLNPGEGLDEEEYAKAFAGAFLFPESAAVQELGSKRNRLTKAELLSIKARYGVSMQGILTRAHHLDILAKEGYGFWMKQLSRAGRRKDEGEPYVPIEQPIKALQLASRALTAGHVTLDQVKSWDLLPEDVVAKLADDPVEADTDHEAQRKFLAMSPEERNRASMEESRHLVAFYVHNPEELIPDFDDGGDTEP
ncbi:MAG: ImmA/IrrE family metallo-endopeptidase [Bdellovibrionaceae bacterium]|nr:ImmA/IrrE family metallo-endopeptidase [Pseudobdellovibrionaceae bacterium]